MAVKIEGATLRSLDELCLIEQQSFNEEAFSKEQICYLLTDYNSIGLVAKVDNEIAGFIIGRFNLVRNCLTGHIMTIDVGTKFRRQGIAQRLMLEIETIFRQKGVKEIRLEVREGNVGAIALYGKIGFKKISKLDHYYGEAHGFYFRKVLS